MSATFLVVMALVAAGVFLSWAARTDRARIDLRVLELWLAVVSAVCLGVAAGLLYWLLDAPVVWP